MMTSSRPGAVASVWAPMNARTSAAVATSAASIASGSNPASSSGSGGTGPVAVHRYSRPSGWRVGSATITPLRPRTSPQFPAARPLELPSVRPGGWVNT